MLDTLFIIRMMPGAEAKDWHLEAVVQRQSLGVAHSRYKESLAPFYLSNYYFFKIFELTLFCLMQQRPT